MPPDLHFRTLEGRRVTIVYHQGLEAMAREAVVLADGFLVGEAAPVCGFEIVDLGSLETSPPDWVKEHLGKTAAGADQSLGAASLALMRGGVAIRVTGNRKSCTGIG